MLILRVLASSPLHGYAIAQRIAQLSRDELSVEEGSVCDCGGARRRVRAA
jgi:DNA-binding PadR family transcriptional regulator